MTNTLKRVLWILGAVGAALLTGWFWGSSGRWDAERALRASELRTDLERARAGTLQARVDLFEVNFGNASRNLDTARESLTRALSRLEELKMEQPIAQAMQALTVIEDARRLAARLDQTANARAAAAVEAVEKIRAEIP